MRMGSPGCGEEVDAWDPNRCTPTRGRERRWWKGAALPNDWAHRFAEAPLLRLFGWLLQARRECVADLDTRVSRACGGARLRNLATPDSL